jgi:hypothetical protein
MGGEKGACGSEETPIISEAARHEGTGARTADRDLLADLIGNLAGEHVGHLVAACLPRSEDPAGNGVDGAQEWRAARSRVGALRRICHRRSKPVLSTGHGLFLYAVVVLQARTNRLADLRPLAPSLLSAIEAKRPGTVTLISQS